MKILRNILFALALNCSYKNETDNYYTIEENKTERDLGLADSTPLNNDLERILLKDGGSEKPDIGANQYFAARFNCIERDANGSCVYRFFTYQLHCWDASPSTPGYGRSITEYSFYSSIPGVGDLFGSAEAPILCGVAIDSGTYEAYLEVWDDLGDDSAALAINIIEDK